MEMTIAEIQAFLANPANQYNCAECPENKGLDSWPGTRKPCGQFNCLVSIICKDDDSEEDEDE